MGGRVERVGDHPGMCFEEDAMAMTYTDWARRA